MKAKGGQSYTTPTVSNAPRVSPGKSTKPTPEKKPGILSTFKENIVSGNTPTARPMYDATDNPLAPQTFNENGNILTGGAPSLGTVTAASVGGVTPAYGSFQTTSKGIAWLKANKEAEAFGEAWMAGGKTSTTITDAAGGTWSATFSKAGGATPLANTKTYALAEQSLMTYAQTLRRPAAVLGIIGAYAFSVNMAVNEKGDALQSYAIAARDAEEVGDYETVNEISEIVNELNDPTLVNLLKLIAPFGINYGFSAFEKAKATKLTLDKSVERGKNTEDQRLEWEEAAAAGTPIYDSPQWWEKRDADNAKLVQDEIDEWNRRQDIIAQGVEDSIQTQKDKEMRAALIKEEDRLWQEEQNKLWEQRTADQIRRDEADRIYYQAKELREIARAKEEKEYFDRVREDTTPSKIGFGIV